MAERSKQSRPAQPPRVTDQPMDLEAAAERVRALMASKRTSRLDRQALAEFLWLYDHDSRAAETLRHGLNQLQIDVTEKVDALIGLSMGDWEPGGICPLCGAP